MAIKAVTIAVAAFGGLVLLGSGTTAAIAGVNDIAAETETSAVEVAGVEALNARVDGASLSIEFYDGDTATLRADQGSTRGWVLRVDDEELRVHSRDRGWFGLGWLTPDWIGGDWFNEGDRLTLLLPESLEGIDADLSLNAGALSADGVFGEVDADVNAGRMDLTGTSSSLDLTLNAGAASVAMADVDEASFDISAGRADAELTGAAPSEVTVDVSAGNLRLTLPDEPYDVRQDRSAGSINSDLQQNPASENTVSVTVSAGSVDLRAG